MHRSLQQFLLFSRKCSAMKMAKPLPVTDSQKCMDLSTTDIINASMAQSQTATIIKEQLERTDSIPLLDPAGAELSSSTFEVTTAKIEPQVVDQAPLPFEELPGPSVLKIWEKYWKYVPLLGRLNWNRNVTPLKYLFNEYGCIVRINGPFVSDIVMIHRPEHIAEVFKQEGDIPIRSGIDILQHYRLHHRKYRLAGPFSLQGSEWLDLREKVDEHFAHATSGFTRKIDIVCDELIGRIRKVRNRQEEVPANFHQDLTRWGLECFSTIMFNKHLGFLESSGFSPTSETSRTIEALTTAHTYMSRCETGFQVWRFFETPFAKKLFAACDVLDEIIGKHVRQTQNKIRKKVSSAFGEKYTNVAESSPVLEKFLVNERIHPEDICTLLMDMIVLGVQATVNCEAFLLYFLAKNPRVQRKLYDEVMTVLPEKDSAVTEKSLRSMPYMKACLQESLRLRPAFPYITRLLPKTISLHGYTIPRGTFVIMANQITSQREENFEDPEKFRPERWLANFMQENAYSEHSYLPFGHGTRSCLGKTMAETKMMLLTAKLVRQFRIEYEYGDIKSSYMMVNVPNKPLRFRFVDRD